MSVANSAYSLLPQSNSDTDCSSEEELRVSQNNRIVNRAAKVQNSKGDNTLNDENNTVNYKPLDNDGDIELTLNKFQRSSNEVSIVKPDGSLEIFSTSRKICFVFSLLLCVFTTVAFLWILPCNVESCPNTSDLKKYNFTWEENLPNIEIYGPISLVSGYNGNQNLIFLTSFLDLQKNHSQSGLRCLKGIDGSHSWEIKLEEEPIDIDCQLFDINKDGYNDCLIYGNNFLIGIDSLSGKKLWDIVEANKYHYSIYIKDFPLIIPDLDEDEVKELLLLCSYYYFTEEKHERFTLLNNVIIISGKTGVIVNKPLNLQFCYAIKNLVLKVNFILSYTCIHSDEKETLQNVNLTKNWPSLKTNQLKWKILSQHKTTSDTAYVNGFRLVVKNQGNCPEDCNVFVDLKVENGNLNKTIYSFNQTNTFGMTPIVLNTKNESGFILKFWKWHSKTENKKFRDDALSKTVMRNNVKNLTQRVKKFNFTLGDSKLLEDKMLLESEYEFQRIKRAAAGPPKNKFKKNVFTNSLHVISETISKITVNSLNHSLNDLTKDEIIQICKQPQICQPSVYRQKQSIFVAQLSPEGAEKLITFNSKYIYEKEKSKQKSEGWQVMSTIRVFNL